MKMNSIKVNVKTRIKCVRPSINGSSQILSRGVSRHLISVSLIYGAAAKKRSLMEKILRRILKRYMEKISDTLSDKSLIITKLNYRSILRKVALENFWKMSSDSCINIWRPIGRDQELFKFIICTGRKMSRIRMSENVCRLFFYSI